MGWVSWISLHPPCDHRLGHLNLVFRSIAVLSFWFMVADIDIVAMPISPFLASPPLHFRGVPDSLAAHHLEGSECCLIHADNPLSATKHTYLNPRVRVGYNPLAYDTVNGPNGLMSSWHVFKVLWENRLRRWFTSPGLKEWTVRRTVRRWMRQNPSVEEKGEFCLINEMQVLAANGWAHV